MLPNTKRTLSIKGKSAEWMLKRLSTKLRKVPLFKYSCASLSSGANTISTPMKSFSESTCLVKLYSSSTSYTASVGFSASTVTTRRSSSSMAILYSILLCFMNG